MLEVKQRVLLDANIFISYLLSANAERVVAKVVRAAILGDYQLLLAEALLTEMVNTVQMKPALQVRISVENLQTLINLLRMIAETIETTTDPIPALTRDPKDDYLLAYALVGQANYLVTEDKDLLVLGQVADVKIIPLRKFWTVLTA